MPLSLHVSMSFLQVAPPLLNRQQHLLQDVSYIISYSHHATVEKTRRSKEIWTLLISCWLLLSNLVRGLG